MQNVNVFYFRGYKCINVIETMWDGMTIMLTHSSSSLCEPTANKERKTKRIPDEFDYGEPL